MAIGILPIAAFAALAVLAVVIRAIVAAIEEGRAGHRLRARHAVVVLACGTLLWLGASFLFMVFASLGHSPHPLREAWAQCLVSFVVLVGVPAAILVWINTRRRRP